MSLSARERILKLRETEYKLQKLQTDLLNGATEKSSSMADFLAHHNELMSLPTKAKNTLPFSFKQKAYYQNMTKAQRLTLPPKIDENSRNRMKQYKDPIDESEKMIPLSAGGLARHPSLALQTLYHQLEDQTAKMAISMPKIAPGAGTVRFKNVLNSQRYIKPSGKKNKTPKSKSGDLTTSVSFSSEEPKNNSSKVKFASNKISSVLQKTKSSRSASKSLKIKPELSEIVRVQTPSATPISNVSIPPSEFDIHALRFNGMNAEQLRHSLSFALTASNMMGVILKSDSKEYRKGPLGWSDKASVSSVNVDVNRNQEGEAHNFHRRRLPDRSTSIREHAPPHQRGLIGVEISGFEPECAFFYRDRNGQFNPHLQGERSNAKVFRERLKAGNLWKK